MVNRKRDDFIIYTKKLLTVDQQEKLEQVLIFENIKRARILAIIILILETIVLLFTLSTNNVPKLNAYTIAYVFMILLCIILLFTANMFYRKQKLKTTRAKSSLMIFYSLIVLWSVFITFLDQENYGQIIVYATNAVAVVIIFHSDIISFLKIHLIPAIILLIGLFYYQPNPNLLVSHYINLFIVFVTCIVASQILYTNFCKSMHHQFLLDESNLELQQKNKAIQEMNTKLLTLANIDDLTRIPNRRSLFTYLENQLQTAKKSLTIYILDIDEFKKYNDYYGHLEGDRIIQLIANAIHAKATENNHFAARYGGEEFVIAAFDLPDNERFLFSNNIIQAVQELQIPHAISSVSPYVTVSIGIASTNINEDFDLKSVLKQADLALYEVKRNGRDQAILYDQSCTNTSSTASPEKQLV